MQLIVQDGTIGLIVAEDIAAAVCEKLGTFRFRAKVNFEINVGKDFQKLMDGAELSDDQKARTLIKAGIPTISTRNSEKFTPHMLNLDRLGAISFSKGCYTGQEVVARTEHLGVSKRRLMRYRSEAVSVAVGDKLTDDGQNVGAVVNVLGHDLLAVTPVALHEKTLRINDTATTPSGLPY